MSKMSNEILLQVENIYKTFPPTKALTDVSMNFERGKITGLVGENGSGKSTLCNIISGVYGCDSGTMKLAGKHYKPASIFDATKHKINYVAQEMATINGLTVAENVFANNLNSFLKFGLVNKKLMCEATTKALELVRLESIDPDTLIDTVSFENRKQIELARALYNDPEVLIIDETTTAISHTGRDIMYEAMKKLSASGKCIIFISHDLHEIVSLCDTVHVLRDGIYITELSGEELIPDNLRRNMIGRELSTHYYRSDKEESHADEVVLHAENVKWENTVRGVTFDLHKGEILGFAGLTECGMHELAKIIFGLYKPDAGEVRLTKNNKKIRNPQASIKDGIAYLSKNRDQESLLLNSTVKENICLPALSKLLNLGFYISGKSEKSMARKAIDELSIKTSSINQYCRHLSGGNKQKVVFGKWLSNDSEIFIFDCPTRGIDVGVKADIYRLVERLKAEGKSIIFISEELPELIGMCDRLLVMKDGIVTFEITRGEQLTEEMLINYMI